MYIFFDELNRWLLTYEFKRCKREKQGSFFIHLFIFSNEYDSCMENKAGERSAF